MIYSDRTRQFQRVASYSHNVERQTLIDIKIQEAKELSECDGMSVDQSAK